MKQKVTVFGSFVVDLMGRTPHLPVPGETVKGSVFKMGPGGKGFNQAVAAHKAGAEVTMVTKLGKDAFADVALGAMEKLGMDKSQLYFTEEAETGVALIIVDENTSQNAIAVLLGACETITAAEVAAREALIKGSHYLLTQLETNISAMEQAVDIAHKNGVQVVFNPAPARPVSDELLGKVSIITPNEVEAETLTGIAVTDEASAARAAAWFFEKGVGTVVITLGSRGAYVATPGQSRMVPAYKVEAIDTTGAGDAFNGGLVAALSEGKDIWQAAAFAAALAALSVQRLGTTPSMPTRQEIDAFIAAQ